MADKSNQASIRISGRYGELFIVSRPTSLNGVALPGPPTGIKLMEVEAIEATTEATYSDINLPGTGETGRKKGPTGRAGTMTVQHIFPEWQAFVKRTQFSGTLAERRLARDRGNRFSPKLVLQVWNDDDGALGAEGWQIEGVEFARLTMGFTQDDAMTRELPFGYDDETEIRGFQRIGAATDAVTGLPAVEYYVGKPAV